MRQTNKILLITMIFTLIVVPVISVAKTAMVPASFAELAEHAKPGVVNIQTVKTIKGGGRVFKHFFGQPFGGNKNPFDDFFNQGMDILFRNDYLVTTKADRMGYRLEGNAVPIIENKPPSIVTEPSMPGSIQIPPNQQPIILLVEQTVGGYAKIATVVSCDINRIAQTIPGDPIRFEPIDLPEAHRLFEEDRERMKRLETLFSDNNR